MNIKEEIIDETEEVVKVKEEIQIKEEIESEDDEEANQQQLYDSSWKDEVIVKPKDECPEDKYKCAKCSYSTDFKNNLSYHIIYKHTSKDDMECFVCPICNNYKAKTKVYLRRHMKKHAPKLYKCDRCDYASKNERNLKEHILTKHELKEKYKCGNCRYKSYTKEHLDDHIMQRHTPDDQKKYYICEICSFKTTSQRYLSRHKVTKHNPKKFVCTMCEFATKYNCNLKQHMYARHTGPSAMRN